MLRSFLWLFMLSLLTHASGQAPGPALIFQPGRVPFASSHASTIVELNDGSLMAAWFGGSDEGARDVAIWSSRTISGSQQAWSPPTELAFEPSTPCWNPVLFHSNDGRLWLYYKFGSSPSTWRAARKYSDDDGKTWSPVEHLPPGLIGPVRAKPLVLPDGVIVSGSSTETDRSWTAWIERSTNDGKTWTRIGPMVPSDDAGKPAAKDQNATNTSLIPQTKQKQTTGIIQPSVVSLGGKHLRFYARSTTNIGHIVVADSVDIGVNWTAPRLLDLPNPNSGIDAVALKDGRVVLVFNNSATTRTPLNIAVSRDGEHFTVFETLEDQPGEFSYPAVIQSRGGDLYLTYTWNRRSIAFVRIPLAQVPNER